MTKSKKTRRRPTQRRLDLRIKPRGHGGWRPGAGRKRQPGRRPAPHRGRAAHNHRLPVHVTMRIVRGLGTLRDKPRYRVVKDALHAGASRSDFRLVEYSIQANHLHCICEADDARSLSNGVRALTIRIARAVNRHAGRRGKVFAERFHARPLRTPQEIRNCLVYVLHNFKRHAKQAGRRFNPHEIDLMSSASWFEGFSRRLGTKLTGPRPVPKPMTWLLRTGWLKHTKPIHPCEVPRVGT